MSDNKNSFANVVELQGTRKPVPALQLTKDPHLAQLLSKAVDPTIQSAHTRDGTRKVTAPGVNALQNIAAKTADNISHADTVMQILPDMALGSQILVSSVTSPKDMVTLELVYKTAPGILPPTVLATCMGVVKDHFNNVYRIKSKMPRVLQEVLFDKGSHIVAILPENSIDELINRSNAVSLESFKEAVGQDKPGMLAMESFSKPFGFLGGGVEVAQKLESKTMATFNNVAMESLDAVYNSYRNPVTEISQVMNGNFKVGTAEGSKDDFVPMTGITVTDNPAVLRIAQVEEKLRKDQINAKLNNNRLQTGLTSAVEAFSSAATTTGKVIKTDDRSLKNLIYKPRKRGVEVMQTMKTDNQLERRTIGRPLVMELPSESVIPVYTPGQEDKHVGYFVLLDQTGNPIKSMNERDSFGELSARLMKASSQTSSIAGRLKQMASGLQCNETEYTDVMMRVYSDMVEQDLLARLRNGFYSNTVALAKDTDFARVMLSRVLQQQHTTVLFLPAGLVTYYARRYNQYGIGVSILDEMKILNNMRAIAMMGNTILGIKNSIPRTNVEITIDETNPDPYKTAEQFVQEISRVNQTSVPFGASAPVDIADYFQRAQYQFQIKGHPGLPDTSIEYREGQTNYSKVDTELEESLQKRALMAMGLTAEHVNNGFDSETATSVVANNLMLSRRVMIIQDQINPHITDEHRKIMRVDDDMQQELRDVLMNAYAELEVNEDEIAKELGTDKANVKSFVINHILNDFIENFEASLPRPNTATVDNQKQALSDYVDLLDVAIDAYMSEEYFTEEMGGEMSRNVESVKKMMRAHFIRAYMAEHGIMTELASLVTLAEDDKPEIDLWEQQKDHIEKLHKSMGAFMKGIEPAKKESNATLDALATSSDAAPAESSSSGDGFGSDLGSDLDTDTSTGGDSTGLGGDPLSDDDDLTGGPLPEEPELPKLDQANKE